MRFESISDLLNFLNKLSALTGLTAVVKDYKGDMKRNGMDRHIHEYPCYLEINALEKAQISFYPTTQDIRPLYIIPLQEDKHMKGKRK